MEMIRMSNSPVILHKTDMKREIGEGQLAAWERQIKHMETAVENNKIYWDEFVKFKFPTDKQYMSMVQYKSSILNFIRFIGQNKDLCMVTKEDIEGYVADSKSEKTANNKKAHIKSILTFMVQNNIAGCLDRMSKETLVLIIQL